MLRRSLTIGLLLIVTVGPPVTYAIIVSLGSEGPVLLGTFWQGAMGNWLATIVGVGAGLPIALIINTLVASSADAKRREEEVETAKANLLRVQKILRTELSLSLAPLREASSGNVTVAHLSVGRWSALSGSGDLRWLDDLVTLETVAAAYEALHVVNQLLTIWLQAMSGSVSAQQDSHVNSLLSSAAKDALVLTEEATMKLSSAHITVT